MDNQESSRQIQEFLDLLASFREEDIQRLADCFRLLAKSRQIKETGAVEPRTDERPKAADSRRVKAENRCSFCGKSEHQVFRMVQGPGVRICDECVNLCYQLIQESVGDEESVAESAVEAETSETAGDATLVPDILPEP